MTDRELLELAAKAAGIENGAHESSKCFVNKETGYAWNPIIDDGDALRLAVKLRLKLSFRTTEVDVSRGFYCASEYLPTYKDECEATRRAIVRVAVEIGKGKQNESL